VGLAVHVGRRNSTGLTSPLTMTRYIVHFASGRKGEYYGNSAAQVKRAIEAWCKEEFQIRVAAVGEYA